MTTLVTGGSGFLGGHVVPLLTARGHEVVALARTGSAASRVEALGARAVAGDLDDPESVDLAFGGSGCDTLVNLASLGFGHAPTIIAAAEDAGLGRAVFVSTTAIFTTIDAASRQVREAAERAVVESTLRWTILRPTMIYGTPGDRNMARLLRLLRRTPVVPLPGGGRGLQQPVHVDDLAAAVVAAVESEDAEGMAYDIAGPEPIDLRGVVADAAAAVGRRVHTVPVPMAAAMGAAHACSLLSAHRALSVEQVRRLAEDKCFDITAAARDLRFAPRSFAEGIREEAKLLR